MRYGHGDKRGKRRRPGERDRLSTAKTPGASHVRRDLATLVARWTHYKTLEGKDNYAEHEETSPKVGVITTYPVYLRGADYLALGSGNCRANPDVRVLGAGQSDSRRGRGMGCIAPAMANAPGYCPDCLRDLLALRVDRRVGHAGFRALARRGHP